ncbi:MAG: hypothetical protein AAF609_13545 [Cyanobacteria bacterium P01_C01_bin.120]
MELLHQALKRKPWGVPTYWVLSTVGWVGYTATTIVLGLFLIVPFISLATIKWAEDLPGIGLFLMPFTLLFKITTGAVVTLVGIFLQSLGLISSRQKNQVINAIFDPDGNPFKWCISQVLALLGLINFEQANAEKFKLAQIPFMFLFAGIWKIFPNPWTFYFSPITIVAIIWIGFLNAMNPQPQLAYEQPVDNTLASPIAPPTQIEPPIRESDSLSDGPWQGTGTMPLRPGLYQEEGAGYYILAKQGDRYCMSYEPGEFQPISVFSLDSEPDENGFYMSNFAKDVMFAQIDEQTLRYVDQVTSYDSTYSKEYSEEILENLNDLTKQCLSSNGYYLESYQPMD